MDRRAVMGVGAAAGVALLVVGLVLSMGGAQPKNPSQVSASASAASTSVQPSSPQFAGADTPQGSDRGVAPSTVGPATPGDPGRGGSISADPRQGEAGRGAPPAPVSPTSQPSSGVGSSPGAPSSPPTAPAPGGHSQPAPPAPTPTAPPAPAPPKLEVPAGGTRIFAGLDCAGPGLGYAVALQQILMPVTPGGRANNPTCQGPGYEFRIPATEHPLPGNRRSEVMWGTGPDQVYREGQLLVFDGRFVGHLGPAATQLGHFHFIWQAHGPRQPEGAGGPDRAFARPLIHLNVSGGRLVLGAGTGHPYDPAKARWYRDLGPYVEGQPTRFRIEDQLSTDPAQGWISVWINDQQVVNREHLPLGTFYPEGLWVQSRGGLYRGSPKAPQITYEQKISWSVQEISPGGPRKG